MRRLRSSVLGAALLLAAISCGGDKAAGPPPTVTGNWTGLIVESGTSATFQMTLAQSGQQVTGTGNISVGANNIAVTGSGTFSHPALNLTVTASGFEPFVFAGTMSDASHIAGTLNGSGFVNVALTVTRQ